LKVVEVDEHFSLISLLVRPHLTFADLEVDLGDLGVVVESGKLPGKTVTRRMIEGLSDDWLKADFRLGLEICLI